MESNDIYMSEIAKKINLNKYKPTLLTYGNYLDFKVLDLYVCLHLEHN